MSEHRACQRYIRASAVRFENALDDYSRLTIVKVAVPGDAFEDRPARDLFGGGLLRRVLSEWLQVGQLDGRDAALADEAVEVVEYRQVLRQAGEVQRRQRRTARELRVSFGGADLAWPPPSSSVVRRSHDGDSVRHLGEVQQVDDSDELVRVSSVAH